MLILKRPPLKTNDVFKACIAGLVDAGIKRDMQEYAPRISSAEEKFEAAIAVHELHKLDTNDFAADPFNDPTYIVNNLYTCGLVGRRAGREYYDKLMSISKLDRCPVCGFGVVKTLEHHLPKQKYPALCITVGNLFPVCSDCNKEKRDTVPQSAVDQTFHPYYDTVDDDEWLHAELIEDSPAFLRFSVEPPESWDHVTVARVKRSFEVYKLSRRYSVQANRVISGLRGKVTRLVESVGPIGVRNDLSEMALSHRSDMRNGYEGVTYSTLANSDWFCSGGAYSP
ncbi:hypothetical protein OG921_04715 [Aldersonia sp. NBC_00410]|uniref:hypothetical protein n=1 Tax=Aldersonia sp. NBC_00410 TaxID=2975954 RepID=UPI00224F0C40|nr:hypothetical protein [Aldersonia sp. NBC_00410]MCX5042475.1 hypothetical protein [Aldersonia sp. NBC_00410]